MIMEKVMTEKQKRVAFEKRPVCSCGVKMKLVEFKGYYTE